MATREKIFEFDATQDIDNLRKLREEIKDLKKVMEELEIGSREYAETSDRLFAKQSRLAELMKEHKKPIEDVAGSFNNLNDKLRELKDRWKATGDDMERAALTVEINKVKGQMNAMNESIGNFQHNVGNYKNAIVDAFSQMGISVTSLTAPLKKMGVDIESIDTSVKLLIGSFKVFSGDAINILQKGFADVTSGVGKFIKSLNGVKAAILGTGIGLLIVALGELVANWDDVTDAMGRWLNINQIAIKSADQIKLSTESVNEEIQFNLRLMKARGESEEAMIDYQLKAIRAEIARLQAIVEENNALLDNVKWWWERKKVIESSDAAAAEIERLEKERGKLLKDKEVLKVYNETQAALQAEKEAHKQNTAALKEKKDMAAEAYSDLQKEIDKAVADSAKAQEEYDKGLEKARELQRQLQEGQLSELELEEMRYKEKLALFEKYNLDTELLEEEHLERMAEIRAEESRKIYAQIAQQAAEKKKKDDEAEANYQKLMKARETATKNMASGTTSILNAAAKAVGENTKLGKGFAIAAATIDTIASAVAGFRAGMNQWADAGPMAWMAPVQAALNATMALTAGFAEVQKIRSVDTSGNSNAGGGMATAMAIPNIEGLSTPMDYTRQVVTDTEREEMNQDSRVYILESDIQQSNNRVRVREEETTF